jgi:hypothetical protein
MKTRWSPRTIPPKVAQHRQRRGALLLELVAAAALFGVVLTIAVPVITSVAAIREASLHRQLAQIELANVMEQIAARHRAGESVAAVAPSITLAPELAAVLSDAQLTVELSPWDDVPEGVRVRAQLTWTTDAHQPAAPVEVLAFFVDRAVAEAAP